MKLHDIDTLETNSSEKEIRERLKNIAVEDAFFHINVKRKKIYQLKFQNNMVSFYYLSSIGVQDMLSPRIYIKISQRDDGCTCNLYYSRTWKSLCLFFWWTIFWGLCVCGSVQENNMIQFICYITAYVSGIWIAEKHRINICKKAAAIVEDWHYKIQ